MQESKAVFWGGLQIAEGRREVKRQEGKRKIYPISHSSRDQQGELRKPSQWTMQRSKGKW